MSIGDDAVAAGMSVMTGGELANTLDTEMNKTRDYIAQRTNAVTPVAKGGTGATTADVARTNLGIPTTNDLIHSNGGNLITMWYEPSTGRIRMQVDTTAFGDIANTSDLAGKANTSDLASKADQSSLDGIYRGLDSVYRGNLSPDVYNRTLGGSYRVAYVNSSGVLGWVPSSRRHKKDIKEAVVDVEAILAMQLVTFLYKVEVDTDRRGELQHGLIAEQLHDLGLDWLVDYGDEGQPEGVRYDRIGLALLPVAQDLARQLAAERTERENLAERVAAIELHLDALGGGLDASAT